jgi:predicted transcriptional regulator
MKKRERLEVIHDILSSIRDSNGKIKPTRLLYSSNLSSLMFKEYVNELLNSGLIEEVKDKKGKKHFIILDKGFDFLRRYSIFNEFVVNLGL